MTASHDVLPQDFGTDGGLDELQAYLDGEAYHLWPCTLSSKPESAPGAADALLADALRSALV